MIYNMKQCEHKNGNTELVHDHGFVWLIKSGIYSFLPLVITLAREAWQLAREAQRSAREARRLAREARRSARKAWGSIREALQL